jgi:prefoldin alpha subunit
MDPAHGDDDRPLSEEERDKAVLMYETFINDRLKVDMDHILSERDKIYEELTAYLELKQNIQMFQAQNLLDLTTLINLGSEFYAQAKVPDTSFIFVKIGLGFHAEMTLDEASAFIDVMDTHLNAKADKLTKKSEEIQLQIHAFQDALQQLMNLPTIETMLEHPAKKRHF